MNEFTHDEVNLMAIYNPGSRTGLIAELQKMRGYLDDDEVVLMDLTDSTLNKLAVISDEAFMSLDLLPDFDE